MQTENIIAVGAGWSVALGPHHEHWGLDPYDVSDLHQRGQISAFGTHLGLWRSKGFCPFCFVRLPAGWPGLHCGERECARVLYGLCDALEEYLYDVVQVVAHDDRRRRAA